MSKMLKKATFNIKLLISYLLFAIGIIFIFALPNYLVSSKEILVNIGSGFITSAIVTIFIEKMLFKEFENLDEQKLKIFAVEILRKAGLLEHSGLIKAILEDSYLKLESSLGNKNPREIIKKYIVKNENQIEVNTIDLASCQEDFDFIVSSICSFIKDKKELFQNTNYNLDFNTIVTPKNGNIFLGHYLAKSLRKHCIYHTYNDYLPGKHYYECENFNTLEGDILIFHDVIKTGKRIIKLIEDLKNRGHTIKHVIVLVYRSDKNNRALIELEKRNIKLNYLVKFNDLELKNHYNNKIKGK